MSCSSMRWFVGTVAIMSLCVAATVTAGYAIVGHRHCHRHRHRLAPTTAVGREKLPRSLKEWRDLGGAGKSYDTCEALWKDLRDFFEARGYTLWEHNYSFITTRGSDEGIVSTGFMYSMPHRAFTALPGSIGGLLEYEYKNALTRAARMSDGRDVVIRVLAVGDDGREHVKLLRYLAQGSCSLVTANHALPLLALIDLDDITFGIFPKVAFAVSQAYHWWAKTSVGDILDMIVQCLEALVFLHHNDVAHRDVFRDNFLVQWLPESLTYDHAPPTRPRVYMNDFELAIQFPETTLPEECVCVGPPFGGSLPDHNGRPMPPEVLSGEPYDPFKLDVWQLGTSFNDFSSTIPEIDKVLMSMRDPDAATRPTAYEAMKALLDALDVIQPAALAIPPKLVPLERPDIV